MVLVNCKICGMLLKAPWVNFQTEPFYPIVYQVKGETLKVSLGDKVHAKCVLSIREQERRE